MKKTTLAAGLLALFALSASANETLTVGATPVPMPKFWSSLSPSWRNRGSI